MVRTVLHVGDASRVPIGDVLIKCWSAIEHCDNKRTGWERFVSIQQKWIVDEDFNWKKKKNEKLEKQRYLNK